MSQVRQGSCWAQTLGRRKTADTNLKLSLLPIHNFSLLVRANVFLRTFHHFKMFLELPNWASMDEDRAPKRMATYSLSPLALRFFPVQRYCLCLVFLSFFSLFSFLIFTIHISLPARKKTFWRVLCSVFWFRSSLLDAAPVSTPAVIWQLQDMTPCTIKV